MQPIKVTYPIDSGLVWLAEVGSTLSGWRGEFCVGNGELRLVAIVRRAEEGVVQLYHVYFYFPSRLLKLKEGLTADREVCSKEDSFVESRVRLLHRLGCPERGRPQYFDFYGLPRDRLADFDREYLPQLLRGDLPLQDHVLPEPLVFLSRGSEAA